MKLIDGKPSLSSRSLTWWILVIGGVAILFAAILAITVVIAIARSDPVLVEAPPVSLEERRLPRPVPVHDDYVGSESCRECHEEEYERYQTNPMAHSAAYLHDVEVIEDYANSEVRMPGGRAYHATREGDQVFHHETFRDPNEEQVYDLAKPISLEVGSGKRGRSYVINEGGHLYLSPLTWYSTRERWGLSPGYSVGNNPRFSRRLIDGCVQCHVGRIKRAPGIADVYEDPVLVEAALGCERCHGPGGRHVAYQNDEKLQKDFPQDPIVNPAKLEPARRESICTQCHLLGSERIVRYGQSEFDFRPGQLLNDVWVSFVGGTGIEKEGTKAVSQVQQMRASQCYQQSQGALGCVSCHDAHGVPSEAERELYYRGRCMECHSEGTECGMDIAKRKQVTASDSCIACHMPKLPATDVPHTSQTDHRVPRTPNQEFKLPEAALDGLTVFDDGGGELPPIVVQRARGIHLARKAEQTQDQALASECLSLLLPIAEANQDDVAVLQAIGGCYWVHGRYRDAEQFWDAALAVNPNLERVLSNLTIICTESKALDGALDYLDALIELNPTRPDLFGRQAHLLGQLGRVDEGIKAAHKALEMDPSLAQAHGWLSEVYKAQGNDELAQKHRAMLFRLLGTRE